MAAAGSHRHNQDVVYDPEHCCCHCGAPGVLEDWLQRFKVSVCHDCSRKREQLISKSNAKAQYLLSDGDMACLGHVERSNPHNAKYAAMKQFLRSQVEVAAVRKFGSMAAVEEERQERMRGKLDKRLSRRRAAEAAAQRSQEQEARVAAAIERFTAQHSQQDMADDEAGGRRPIAAAAEPEEVVDGRSGKRLRRFGRDMAAVEVEEL